MLGKGRHGSRVKMSTSSVAIRPDFLSLLLSLWASAPTFVRAVDASAAAPEAAAMNTFVPPCAKGCYRVFIENNRFLDECGASPSLECLCRRYGSSGATFGEGAVQCMAAEMNGGLCAGDQIPPAAISGAYTVCHNVAGFAVPTQRTIVATTAAQTRTFMPSASSTGVSTTSSTTSSRTSLSTSWMTSPRTSSRASSTISSTASSTTSSAIPSTASSMTTSTTSSATTSTTSSTTSSATSSTTASTTSSTTSSSSPTTALPSSTGFTSLPTTLITAPRETSSKESPNPGSYTSQILTTTSIPSNTSVTPVAAPNQTQGVARLNGGQVAGITVGAVAGVFLLMLLAFFARRRRRDRLQNGENAGRSSFYDNHGGPRGGGGGAGGVFARLRDSFGRVGSKKGNGQNGSQPQSMQITRPMGVGGGTDDAWAPRPYETIAGGAPPRAEGNIGMALSPDIVSGRFQPAGPLYASAAIPAAEATTKRESLQFTPPQHEYGQFSRGWEASPSGSIRPTLTLAIPASRDSDVTEFAEDGDEEVGADGAQIWRPPPGDPHSATTYYVADKWGNWRRRSTLKGGNAPRSEGGSGVEVASAAVRPLNLGRSDKEHNKEEMSASSSVYSPMTSSPRLSDPENPVPPMPPFPKSAYAKMLAMNSDLSNQPGSVARLPPATPEKKSSPVSPGVSPVAYPAIPRRDIRRSMTPEQRQLHQQQQAKLQASPTGQPSPTLGSLPEPVAGQALGRSLTGSGPRAQQQGVSAVGTNYGSSLNNRDLAGRKSPAVVDYANPYSDAGGSSPYTGSRSGSSNRNHPKSPDSLNTLVSVGSAKRVGGEKAVDAGLDAAADDGEFIGARSQWKRDQPQQKLGTTTVEALLNKDNMHLPATPGWEPRLTPTRRGEDLFLKVG